MEKGDSWVEMHGLNSAFQEFDGDLCEKAIDLEDLLSELPVKIKDFVIEEYDGETVTLEYALREVIGQLRFWRDEYTQPAINSIISIEASLKGRSA